MRKISLLEKIRFAHQINESVPLKGHFKLILEDVRDGKQIVTEVDNMITEAVSTIINHNYCGLQNLNEILPLRNLFGGVFCFQNAQTESASNFNPPNDTENPLIAHAGDVANNTGSTLRGSPVSNDFVITDTSIKQVWLWDNTQGNGHIASLSLVSNVLGNMGLKPFNDEISPFDVFGEDSISNASWSEDISKQYPMNISADGKLGFSVWLDGTTFKEHCMRHDYNAFGIMRDSRTWQLVTTRTATVRGGSDCFIFDDDSFYYIARVTSSTALAIDKVNKSTFAVTQADVSFSGVDLLTESFHANVKNNAMRIYPFDGTYLYYPNSAKTSFYKLNLSDNSDKALLGGSIDVWTGRAGTAGCQFVTPTKINDGLIVGSNYIINGNNVYAIKPTKSILEATANQGYDHFLFLVRQGASVYGNCKQTTPSSYTTGQGCVLAHMFLSTIANLPQARDKSTSQTMRVEYTLTEQTS